MEIPGTFKTRVEVKDRYYTIESQELEVDVLGQVKNAELLIVDEGNKAVPPTPIRLFIG
ncbi:MAG: hypothetical protein ACKVOE_10540 [Rickettsiales bacterium]